MSSQTTGSLSVSLVSVYVSMISPLYARDGRGSGWCETKSLGESFVVSPPGLRRWVEFGVGTVDDDAGYLQDRTGPLSV